MANTINPIQIHDEIISNSLIARVRNALEATGVVLLRQVCRTAEDFERLSCALASGFHTVGIRQPLRQTSGDGHTTEVFRNNFILLGHSEGAYRPWPPVPELCFFMCLKAPVTQGGETTLIDGVGMFEQLPVALQERLRTQGLIFEMLWEPARWRAEFGVETETELAEVLSRIAGARYSLENDCLHLFVPMPAIIRTRHGHESFASGLLAHLPEITHPRYAGLPVYVKPSNCVYFGDGQLLDPATVNALIDAHDQVMHRHRWHDDDVLIVDNLRYMHGREMLETPSERILISRFGQLAEAACTGASA